MNQLKELFHPTKKKLIVFVLILLSSSFILYGNLVGDITTYSQDRPSWINGLITFWSFISVVGSIFQGPLIFISQVLPGSSDLKDLSFTPLVLINSYVQALIIGRIWEIKKADREKKYLKVYGAGVVVAFLGLIIKSVSESSNDLFFLIAGAVGMGVIVYLTKRLAGKVFQPIFILTILFMFSLFGYALSDFEESYCWNNVSGYFKDHMDCHEKFDLQKALSEVYFK